MTQTSEVGSDGSSFPSTGLRLKRHSPYLGASVAGIDLRQPIGSDLCVELRQALVDHGVLFFSDQELEGEQLLRVAGAFGTPLRHNPYLPSAAETTGVEVIESGGSTRLSTGAWHADVTWRTNPPNATLLYAREVPGDGGDTIWTSSSAAYRALHPLLGAYLETLTAVNFVDANGCSRDADEDAVLAALRAEHPPIDVPVVTTHPQTGEKSIFVSELHTLYLKGVPRVVSDSLLSLLFGVLADPERHARFRWKPGCLAIWDNRLVQHRAVREYGAQRRVLQRVTIA